MAAPEPPAALNDTSSAREGAGSWRSLAAVLASAGVLAVWINFDGLHRYHTGDSLVPILMSLYRWTPFYWEADRLGSFLPLLARPFANPLTNMLVQSTAAVWLAISAFFLGARYILGRGPWIAAGAIAAAIYLGFQSPGVRFEMMITQQCYGTSLALAFGGLVCLEQVAGIHPGVGRPLGIAALLLALWVNVSLIASLLPVIVLHRWAPKARLQSSSELASPVARPTKYGPAPASRGVSRHPATGWFDRWFPVTGVAVGFLVSVVLSRFGQYHERYAILPLSEMLSSWLHLWHNVFATFPGSMWVTAAALLAATGGVLLVNGPARQSAVEALGAALPLMAGAFCQAALMSSLSWVAMNHYAARYLIASVQLTLLAVAALACTVIMEAIVPRWRGTVNWATLAGFIGSLVVLHGVPAAAAVRADIDRRTGRLTPEIVETGCTHVIGSYWVVWPAVFHANLELFERGDRRTVWGIASRCAPTRRFWAKVPPEQRRFAAAIDDNEVEMIAVKYGVGPLVEEKRLQTIRILRPAGVGTRAHP